MKKIFALLLCVFITVAVFAASQTTTYYVDTEQKYVFSVDNLSQTIPEFVEDTAKQDAMANKYLELANKETGAVSVKDLFEICEAGGFKTRRAEGYESCRNFVIKLLETVEQELEDGTLTGYCPGLDENGKNPNRLKSITGETQVGDFCSSSNIAAGEVVFKKGYNCTCAASACNSCCESIGGACLTKVADGNGNCLRKEYDNVQNLNAEGAALKFCESKAQRGCKVINAIKNFNSVKGKVVCNATQAEFDTVVALNTPCPDTAYALTSNNNTKEKCHSFCRAQTKAAGCKLARSLYRPSTKECVCNPDTETVRRLNMKYYQVCGKDKGKTGSQEICKDDLFTNKIYGGTQVDVPSAIILAKEWARVNKYREIECDTKIYDYSALDDSILCSSIDKDKNGKRAYFEFVFDDLRESSTYTIDRTFWNALFGRIYGYEPLNFTNTQLAYATGTEAVCTGKIAKEVKKYCPECTTYWAKGSTAGKGDKWYCYIQKGVLKLSDMENDFNIDPFMFCKGAQTQLQASGGLDEMLKQYIANASGYPVSKIECYPRVDFYCGDSKKGVEVCSCDNGNLVNYDPRDDAKTCVVHGDKDYYVKFVFDDIAELSKKREKGALQSMGCVVNGGTFNGQECKFANKSQCDTYIKSMSKVCPQCTKPKWNPDTGLCEVPDAAAVTAMEKHEKNAMIVGGVVVSVVVTVVTAGSGAPVVAIVLSGVEVAGGAMEYFAQQHIDGMAHDFFLKSAKCNNASCATKMLYEDLQEMANIQNDLEDYEINALDAEFERLLGLIDPGSDFYMAIVEKGATLEDNQKGFFDPDSWNQAQVWRAIGIGLQFLSLGTGPITKIISSARFGSKFPKMQAMLLKQVKITKQIRDAKKVVNTVDKTADAARNMDASQAKKLEELNNDIAKIESKANRTPEEAEKLKKLHQERNTLMNKVGTKDADELAKMQKEAFNQKDIQKAQEDYDKIMERRNYVAKYMAEHNGNPPSGVSKQAVREINENVSKAESKLKDLGQEVNPMEPLEIGKKPAVKPVEGADAGKAADKADNVADAGKGVNKAQNSNISSIEEIENSLGSNYKNLKRELKTNPDKTLVFDKNSLTDEEWKALNESLAKENLEVVSSGESMFVRQKRVFPDAISDIRNRAYSEFNAHADNIKKGVEKELNIPKSHLSNDEWKALEADLNKEGLEITEANDHYFRVKKSTKANPVSNVVNKVDNVASSTKSGNKVDEVVNAGRAATKSKTEKIAEARVRGDLGYHGTDADIAMDDMIRSSANSSDQLGGVGYGIARDYDAAEKYAVKRLIERQNVGKNIKFSHQFQGDVLVVDCDEALNLSNKTGYVYTTAKNSDIKWDALQNGYVGVFDAAQMPNSVEILDKTAFNLDDLVRQGKLKIIEPKATKAANASSGVKAAPKAANKADNVAGGASKASTNVSSGKKMYSPAFIDGNVYKPTTIPEQSESIWELTEVAPNKYQITVYKDAEKKILANPAFLEGANKQVMGYDRVELIEPGIAEMDVATGKLRVTKVPEVWLVENASTAAKTVNKVDNVADASKGVKPTKTVGKAVSKADDVGRGAGNVVRNAIPSDFSPVAKEYINQINDIGQTRDYVVIKGVGKRNSANPFTRKEDDYVNQLLKSRNDLIARPVTQGDGTGGTLGANKIIVQKTDDMFSVETSTGIDWVRRLTTKPVDNLRGKSITTINGKPVFLEPLDNGGLIGNIEGRPVVVVNYDGHKIPFYTSSGKAGKLEVPTGKWEVFFGFGKDNTGFRWLNKGDTDSIVDHYGSPELRKIAEALDNAIGDQRNLEDVFQTISRKIYNGIGNVASYDGPVVSEDFINSMLDFVPVNHGDNRVFSNIKHVKSYFFI